MSLVQRYPLRSEVTCRHVCPRCPPGCLLDISILAWPIWTLILSRMCVFCLYSPPSSQMTASGSRQNPGVILQSLPALTPISSITKSHQVYLQVLTRSHPLPVTSTGQSGHQHFWIHAAPPPNWSPCFHSADCDQLFIKQ